MTEGKSSIKTQKSLLALNPEEDAEFQKKIREVKGRPKTAQSMTPGVLYVAHLPRGLFEPQLKAYFKQFGTILRTGGTKGYGFVEFECDEVAKIVAETMNNYLMRERLIKCELIPPEKVHEKLFAGSQAGFKKPKHPAVTRYNRTHEPDGMKKLTAKLLRKESKLRKRLAAKGIDYDFLGFSAQVPDKKAKSDPDVSVSSEDVTPVCTPSLLERRKSIKVDDNDDDEEIVIKPYAENFDDIEKE
ncbi:MKI67 FHA domain-interacting nucleolar phosphoprotein [Triplophysa tibetana]|uniref:MKI67 FHA domain-interacting nucleolar phosphoprotein n=1 Tax=Triplophysa tibetana TaxID=1572043 RepID=A0A5A9P0X7_9TELE|nr:MKI67 FHA domain-interacting nucleolar phosphoprotein [Triplophysa tibetana]